MVVGAVALLIVRGLYHRPHCPIVGSKWDSSARTGSSEWRRAAAICRKAVMRGQ